MLCQRLDVAGGDRTKVLECASWAPAFLAVRTGLALGYTFVGGIFRL